LVIGKEGNGTLRVRVLPDNVTLWEVACDDELGAGGRCRGCDTDVRGICPDALRRSVSFIVIFSTSGLSVSLFALPFLLQPDSHFSSPADRRVIQPTKQTKSPSPTIQIHT
jgi:hypothetical protein